MTTLRFRFRRLLGTTALLCLVGCDNEEAAKVPEATEQVPAVQKVAPTDAETDAGTAEEVVAWINGEALPEAEVARHLRRIDAIYAARKRTMEDSQRAVKRRLVTEKLIDRRLLQQWMASHEKPPIAPEEVDRALEARIRESFGERAVLERHLARRGETLAEFRRDLRERIVLERLLKQRDLSEVDAGSVEEKFESVVARPPHHVRVRAASLFLPWPDSTSRDAFRDAVVREATTVRTLDEFRKTAARLDEKWDARFEADTGWTEFGQTASDVEKTLFSTEEGHVTEVVSTPLGVQLYFVREREVQENPHLERLKPVLEQRLREEHFQERRRTLVDKLRKDAVIRWNEGERK